jgi:hypothetical protein
MTENKVQNKKKSLISQEIDLFVLFNIFWKKRKIIFITTLIFFLLGVLFSSLQTTYEYKAETTFLIKSGGGGMNSLGSLAGLAGVNLQSEGSNSGVEIEPSLYPRLINSIDFKQKLINAPLILNGYEKEMSYAFYYENLVKPSKFDAIKSNFFGFPRMIFSFFKPSSPPEKIEKPKTSILSLSSEQESHFARLKNQLKVESIDGVMSLTFTMEDPLLAAQMAQFSIGLLEEEVINYKISSLNEELKFTQLLYEEKRKSFEDIQSQLGYFRERNQNSISASIQNQLERLQSEYNLRLSIVTQVANSLESSKIQIARDTPIFSTLDPVVVPSSPIQISKFYLLIVFTISGFLLSMGYVLIFDLILNNKLKEIYT